MKTGSTPVRGTMLLPNGVGRERKIIVFASGDLAQEAREAGADYVGSVELVQKIQKKEISLKSIFTCLASIDELATAAKISKILGPKGLMPNAKNGTVIKQGMRDKIHELKNHTVFISTDKYGIVHSSIGRIEFSKEQFMTNLDSFIRGLVPLLPSTSIESVIRSVYLSSTMGPSLLLQKKEILSTIQR